MTNDRFSNRRGIGALIKISFFTTCHALDVPLSLPSSVQVRQSLKIKSSSLRMDDKVIGQVDACIKRGRVYSLRRAGISYSDGEAVRSKGKTLESG